MCSHVQLVSHSPLVCHLHSSPSSINRQDLHLQPRDRAPIVECCPSTPVSTMSHASPPLLVNTRIRAESRSQPLIWDTRDWIQSKRDKMMEMRMKETSPKLMAHPRKQKYGGSLDRNGSLLEDNSHGRSRMDCYSPTGRRDRPHSHSSDRSFSHKSDAYVPLDRGRGAGRSQANDMHKVIVRSYSSHDTIVKSRSVHESMARPHVTNGHRTHNVSDSRQPVNNDHSHRSQSLSLDRRVERQQLKNHHRPANSHQRRSQVSNNGRLPHRGGGSTQKRPHSLDLGGLVHYDGEHSWLLAIPSKRIRPRECDELHDDFRKAGIGFCFEGKS